MPLNIFKRLVIDLMQASHKDKDDNFIKISIEEMAVIGSKLFETNHDSVMNIVHSYIQYAIQDFKRLSWLAYPEPENNPVLKDTATLRATMKENALKNWKDNPYFYQLSVEHEYLKDPKNMREAMRCLESFYNLY